MEKSTFEKISDSQLKKYLQFVNKVLNNITFDSINECYENILTPKIGKKLATPLGLNELSRLDIEYLYYLLNNNDPENETIDRPQLGETSVDYVVVEKVITTYRKNESLGTYLPDDIDVAYLFMLKDNGDIDPYGWSVYDKNEKDDIIDDYFEL